MFRENPDIKTDKELLELEKFLEETYCLNDRIEAFRNMKLYTIEIEVSRFCNYSCVYCYSNSGKGAINQNPEVIKSLLYQAKDYGIKEIYWIGGEPLLYPQMGELLALSKALGFRNMLATNGSPINDKNAETIISFVDVLYFHLDSLDPAAISKLQSINIKQAKTRIKNSIRGIERLINAGYDPKKIRLSCVLNKETITGLRDLLDWAILEKGFHTSTLIPVACIGRATKVYEQLKLNIDELHEAFKLRAEIEKRPFLLRLGPSEFCKHYELTNCFVSVVGNLYSFVGIKQSHGVLNNQSLTDILISNYKKIAFADMVSLNGFCNLLDNFCDLCKNQKYCFGTIAYYYLKDVVIDSYKLCCLKT